MKQYPAGALGVGPIAWVATVGLTVLGLAIQGARVGAAAEEPAEPAPVEAGKPVPAETPAELRTNVAVVDVERAIALCKAGEAVKKQLDELTAAKQKPLLAKQEELRKQTAAFEAEKEKLSQEQAENKALALDRMEADLERLLEEARQELTLAEQRRLDPLLERAEGLIKEVAEQMGFTIVLEKTNPELLYASDTVDLTQALIDRLNQAPLAGK
jgi:outer membrane protein